MTSISNSFVLDDQSPSTNPRVIPIDSRECTDLIWKQIAEISMAEQHNRVPFVWFVLEPSELESEQISPDACTYETTYTESQRNRIDCVIGRLFSTGFSLEKKYDYQLRRMILKVSRKVTSGSNWHIQNAMGAMIYTVPDFPLEQQAK